MHETPRPSQTAFGRATSASTNSKRTPTPTPPPRRADCSSNRSPARRSTRRELRLPRGGRRVRHREHGRLDPGADGRRRPRQRRRRLRRRRSTPPRDHRGALLASVNRGLLGHQQRRRLTARVLKSGMTRAPVFRVADVAEAEALVSWTRDNFAALKEAAEGRRTTANSST